MDGSYFEDGYSGLGSVSGGEKYALGVVLDGEDDHHLLRLLGRTAQLGHPLLAVRRDGTVLYAVGVGDEPMEVHQEVDYVGGDGETAREVLVELARTYGLRGLVVHEDPSAPVDLEASFEALEAEDTFAVESLSRLTEAAESDHAPVVVGLPAYNEEKAVGSVVEKVRNYADVVVVVDDGSTDRTAERASEAGAVVVRHSENRGYGAALQTLFTEGKQRNASSLVVIDADGQHDASDVQRLLRRQRECEADIVIGSRYTGSVTSEIPLYRRFGLWVINVLTNLGLGTLRKENRIGDTQSGFRAYGPRAIESLAEDETLGSNMQASTDILFHARKRGYEIDEIGIRIRYDLEDTYTQNPLSHGYSVVKGVLRLIEQDRPLTTLGVPGFVSAFVGLTLGYWSVFEYGQTGEFPLVLVGVSGLLLLVGFFASVVAIVHQSLRDV
ncbi:glycosyltransferase family 2 protein [Haloprofundus sp. MHR1]|uniref:glycosyltransferase family 2 protein n=1 Tax=Haloprofundus sp. MHR1 TaxID=2572921 RepID=UPI0010BE4749|nr:glycosyltransferase family 2 protein [Haloprofundus sp. MHR1]QCJ47422.1 glycosyltransferase family 2 protein [Haloprofundus sp. MHR1]